MMSNVTAANTQVTSQQEVQRQFNLGRLFGFDIVFCHNDLHALNMLQSDDIDNSASTCKSPISTSCDNCVKHVTLIDYEYAAYNFRGYDLANYFQGEIFLFCLLTFV